MARAIVHGKVRNGRAVINRYQKNNPDESFAETLDRLDQIMAKIERQTTVASLMGTEGSATAMYFQAYGRMFRQELRFEVRSKRPPKDPVNALLSLGYTLLTNEILAHVIAAGLDPYLGFLHGVVYGRPALALDLIEEFRHPFIDRFVLNLFNNELLTAGDFRPVEGDGVYLTNDALKTFLQRYETQIREPFTNPQTETPTTGRDLLKSQVQAMSKSIMSGQIYQPFYGRW